MHAIEAYIALTNAIASAHTKEALDAIASSPYIDILKNNTEQRFISWIRYQYKIKIKELG